MSIDEFLPLGQFEVPKTKKGMAAKVADILLEVINQRESLSYYPKQTQIAERLGVSVRVVNEAFKLVRQRYPNFEPDDLSRNRPEADAACPRIDINEFLPEWVYNIPKTKHSRSIDIAEF